MGLLGIILLVLCLLFLLYLIFRQEIRDIIAERKARREQVSKIINPKGDVNDTK